MMLTFDDQFLLTVAEDGCLFTWRVFDKDGRGIKREREVGFAEEVLVTTQTSMGHGGAGVRSKETK